MTDATIFYSGIFCFSLIVLALVLTVLEFRRTPRRPARTAGPHVAVPATHQRSDSRERMRARGA